MDEVTDPKLMVLKLFLDALGVSANITTVSDRKTVQKAVYLGQIAGVDLGYRFSWYLMGPYSPPLTEDYYTLNNKLKYVTKEAMGKALRDDLAQSLSRIRPLLTKPDEFPREPAEWLELLASLDYLLRVSKKSLADASELLKQKKPDLYPHISLAQQKLAEYNLIPHAA